MQSKTKPNPNSVAAFLAQGYLAENTADIQRLSVTAYRLLAKGAPVSLADLAGALASNEAKVSGLLEALPPSVFDLDEDSKVIAFIGLSLARTTHRFTLGARKLHTWCVLDALFLPEILGERARVATKCPASGEAISIEVAPDRIVAASPPGVVMSVVVPDAQACRDDLRGAFCSHVSLFAGADIFAAWSGAPDNASCVPLAEAFDLARARNRERYPDIDLTIT